MNETVKILVVDDDPDILFATARILKSSRYEVIEAATGSECIESVHKNRPDLILLDVVLPDADGLEICKQLKNDPNTNNPFVVMISGAKTSSFEQAEGLDLGADGYIARPISNRELKARINAWVRILLTERERDQVIVELQHALAKIKRLSGLLPICMHCKKIRDENGYWNQLESYLHEHSEADFSHSICQECAEKHYPDIFDSEYHIKSGQGSN